MNAHEVFEEVAETRFDICRRCFKSSKSTGNSDTLGGGTSCGDDCGSLSATLEEESIQQSEIDSRASNLLYLIQQDGHEIDEKDFNEATNLLAGIDEPPRSILIDAVRAGLGEVSVAELMDEHGLESKVARRTRNLLSKLPTSNISEEQMEGINDVVASQITTVVDSHRPGWNVYYIPDSENIPEKYQSIMGGYRRPERVMRTVIRESENWFWTSSPKSVENWLAELDEKLQDCAAKSLYQHIESRQRYSSIDSPSTAEQFRRSVLWPVLKEDAERIMGFLRRSDDPQPLDEIAEYVGLSRSTVWTILVVLNNATKVSTDSGKQLWQAT